MIKWKCIVSKVCVVILKLCPRKTVCSGFITQLDSSMPQKWLIQVLFFTLTKALALQKMAIKIFVILIKSEYRSQKQKLRGIQILLIPCIRSFPVSTLFQLPNPVHPKFMKLPLPVLWSAAYNLLPRLLPSTLLLPIHHHSPLTDHRFEDDFWSQWLRISAMTSLSRSLCLAFYVWEMTLDWVES